MPFSFRMPGRFGRYLLHGIATRGVSTLAFVSFILLSFSTSSADSASKPNVVVILADDLGYGSVGCYGADPGLVKTPNIDRLAAEGRRFTNAYAPSSVCSPTRYALLTGRYCWRTDLKHGVLMTDAPLLLEPDRPNLAAMLESRGYATAAIGKWHLGYGPGGRTDFTRPLTPGPLDVGFDRHFGVPANHGDQSGVYVEDDTVFGLRSADRLPPEEAGKNFMGVPFLGIDAPQRVDAEVMPRLTSEAVSWIESRDPDEPFFLYYTPVAIHNPLTPSPEFKGSSRAGRYGDWIQELDASVGRVLDALARKGFAENTIVLFTSDNGPEWSTGPARGPKPPVKAGGLKLAGPYRGGKHDVWDGGFRVPYIVRWPGHVPAGSVGEDVVGLVDTFPTLAALTGQAPAGDRDGRDVTGTWLGTETPPTADRHLILHSEDGVFAVLRGRWKWIEGVPHPNARAAARELRKDQFRPQLYDLEADPAETTDVSAAHPEVVAELRALLDRSRHAAP